ncbi:hypothetical protein H072_460 [Dactylellina haptotyla CBS 200.50]|uniref:Uncharacterized protein n=1 Tax=Dactylellina haptotyla (strain CBS 200.50) TaxID=1284197 RepID=S8CCZ6_DACHA|nr:hypothetical protein H072_460 [Dactylellina haptotyla CBS 200.50]
MTSLEIDFTTLTLEQHLSTSNISVRNNQRTHPQPTEKKKEKKKKEVNQYSLDRYLSATNEETPWSHLAAEARQRLQSGPSPNQTG